jgi:hypothetical protein
VTKQGKEELRERKELLPVMRIEFGYEGEDEVVDWLNIFLDEFLQASIKTKVVQDCSIIIHRISD